MSEPTAETEACLRGALRAIADDTPVQPAWDEVVADLDRVVVIARPSVRHSTLVVAAAAAVIAALIGVLAAVRHDERGPAASPPRYFSFVKGDTSEVQTTTLGPGLQVDRFYRPDLGAAIMVNSLTHVALPAGEPSVVVTVSGVPVRVSTEGAVTAAFWELGILTRTATVTAAGESRAPDPSVAAGVRRALVGLVLPLDGCTVVDPVCRPIAELDAAGGGDAIRVLLAALPSLVAAPAAGTAAPPGFRREPLLTFDRGGSVDQGDTNLTFWSVGAQQPTVPDLERVLRQLTIGQPSPAPEPVTVTVSGRPAMAMTSASGGLVLWSPAPGWLAFMARPAGFTALDDLVAEAGRVGEVDAATWAALPSYDPVPPTTTTATTA